MQINYSVDQQIVSVQEVLNSAEHDWQNLKNHIWSEQSRLGESCQQGQVAHFAYSHHVSLTQRLNSLTGIHSNEKVSSTASIVMGKCIIVIY